MRTSVTIDGVTLTRAQVEEAARKLNEPEPFKPGDKVKWTGGRQPHYQDARGFLVVSESTALALACQWPTLRALSGDVWLIGLNTGNAYLLPRCLLRKVPDVS